MVEEISFAPLASIIIPAYNNFELTQRAIESVRQSCNSASYEIVLIDDCSTDRVAEIEQIIPDLVVVRNESNLQFLKSCNKAASICTGQFLVFLNNDTEVRDRWLDELLLPFYDTENVGLTGSMLINSDGGLQEAGGIVWASGKPANVGSGDNPKRPEYNYRRDVDYLSGASLCISRAVWDEVGGFSEEFAPCYYEDTDLAFKVRQAGYRTIYAPQSRVIHHEGSSNGRDIDVGSKRYQVINAPKFELKWHHAFKELGKENIGLHLQKDRNIHHRILLIDHVTPDPDADAGSYAAIQEIRLLQSLGFKVTFMPDNLAYMGRLTRKLQRMGVEVLYPPFFYSVYEAIEQRGEEFDAFYITRYEIAEKYLPAIRRCSKAKLIFNNADLHFLREMRTAAVSGGSLQSALKTRARELAVLVQADAVLSYNDAERAVILSHTGLAENVFRCPWVLEDKLPGKPFTERDGLAFLGSFSHPPNVEAMLFFAREVMPILARDMPGVTLRIYGSNPTEEIKSLAGNNIEVIGFVENLDVIFHTCRLFIVPLLSGAGIKGKVLESMAYGAPAILSDIATEAIGLSHKVSTWIANTPEEWVSGIKACYHDELLWQKIANNCQIVAREQFSFKRGQQMFKQMLVKLGVLPDDI